MNRGILSLLLASALVMSGCGAKMAESDTSTAASTEASKESTEPSISTEVSVESTEISADITSYGTDETSEANPQSEYTYHDCQAALSYIQHFAEKADKKSEDEYYTLIKGVGSLYNSGNKDTADAFVETATDVRLMQAKAKSELDSEIERLNQKYDSGKNDPDNYLYDLVDAFNKYKENAGVSDDDIE